MKKNYNSEYNLTKAYDAIKEYILSNKYPPSVRDLMKLLSVSSTSTVSYYLDKLERRNLIKRTNNKSRSIELVDYKKSSNTYPNEIPLLGDVAAGIPMLANSNVNDVYEVSNNLFDNTNQDIFMLTINGDSMINVGIFDKDIVVVRKQNTAENREIVVALIDDSATVKRFFKEKDTIRLQPENNLMKPIYAKNVTILGKVIGLIRHIK